MEVSNQTFLGLISDFKHTKTVMSLGIIGYMRLRKCAILPKLKGL